MKHTPYRLGSGSDGLSRHPLLRWWVADSCLSLLALAGGCLLIGHALPAETATQLLSLHLPAEGLHPLLFWLRVSLALLPSLFVLGIAGLCCCGGALCSGVLLLRGLCDGAALGALWLVKAEPIPFLIRLVTLLLLRLALSLWSRIAAGRISDPTLQHEPGRRGLSPLMLRHLTCLLIAAALGAALCGLYTALVYL